MKNDEKISYISYQRGSSNMATPLTLKQSKLQQGSREFDNHCARRLSTQKPNISGEKNEKMTKNSRYFLSWSTRVQGEMSIESANYTDLNNVRLSFVVYKIDFRFDSKNASLQSIQELKFVRMVLTVVVRWWQGRLIISQQTLLSFSNFSQFYLTLKWPWQFVTIAFKIQGEYLIHL